MEVMEGQIREYAWGSRTALADLLGRPVPSPRPQAELWLGAHPATPATLRRERGVVPLTEVIETEPERTLGAESIAKFGRRLPFLLKVLAAAEPLSIQAHPDEARAAAGFAEERAAGVPLTAPERTYVDPYHKPELLVAVERFDALCGFQDPAASARLLARLRVSALDTVGRGGVVAALRDPDPAVGLRDAVTALLTVPAERRSSLVSAVAVAAKELAGEHPSYDLVGELAARYPGDIGVVVAMLLNRVTLAPGEAVWMPAGNPHAYLEGVGIEIMSASDNVLRGGLTRKRVNVPELLKNLRFEVLADPVVKPRKVARGVTGWPVPIPDFALVRAVVSPAGPVVLPRGGPRIVLCLRGTVAVDDGEQAVALRGGAAAFAPAAAGAVTVTGDGEVYQASVGE